MARKRKKKRKTRSDSIPKLVKKLDTVFSRYIRLLHRDRYGFVKCFTCPYKGSRNQLQAGHFLPRRYKATRWHPMNVKPQCYVCNIPWEGRPQEFRARLIEEYGEDEVKALEERRHESDSLDREELKQQIKYYQAEVKRLQNEH